MRWFEREHREQEAAQKKVGETEVVGYKKDVKLIDLILRHANPPADITRSSYFKDNNDFHANVVEARQALQRLAYRVRKGDQRYLQIEERAQLELLASKEGRYLEAETHKLCRLRLEAEIRESEKPDAPHHYVAKRLRDTLTGDECFDFGVCSICGKPPQSAPHVYVKECESAIFASGSPEKFLLPNWRTAIQLMQNALWEACERLSVDVRSRADYEALQRWQDALERVKGFPK